MSPSPATHPARPHRRLRHAIPPGATLLDTDGLVERRERALADGVDALLAALTRHRGLSLDDLLDALVAELAGPHPQDDVANLAVRTA